MTTPSGPQETASAAQTGDFAQFSRLPSDIRHEIWRAASSSPAATPGVCIFTMAKPEHCGPTSHRPAVHAPLVVHEPVNPALLATSTEAYDIAQRSKTPTRAYNPATDILYIPKDGFYNFTGGVCGHLGEPWVADIRHLALALPVADQGLWLPIALLRLASLKTLSIVYPAASGTCGCHDDVLLPADSSTPLRQLTEEERADLTIVADYEYETHFGTFPIRWRKNADEHLTLVERELVMNTLPNRRILNEEPVPIWDADARRLALRYQARVFEPLKVKTFASGGRDV
ncbi:hypothetical protein B0T22DRAFT_37937 [Podospora appendiculata]|uniref:2EXR domain-containing protein n=1 Tax=Podospora appendiculata TaxID=314037 RepID=A0AAE1CG49_9PEZI|nr:hypothetical protein B0T22DRAFT_37937 [Podospora appendiculata]